MSSNKQRVDGVFATRMNLTVYKAKGSGASRGYDLLKRKSDALKIRYRLIVRELKNNKIWHTIYQK